MPYVGADNTVDIPGEEVFELLKPGQKVDTPLGSGVIKSIALHAGRYGDRIELEPPAVTVKLDDPDEGVPDEIVVCMCKLGLEDPKHEAIIKKEFARLWPPITEDVPEDIHMLMDIKKKDVDLEMVRSRFERNVNTANRVASAALRYRKQRQLFRDYVQLALHLAEPVIDSVSEVDPGDVLTGIENVDLGDKAVVVLNSSHLQDKAGQDLGQVVLVLYDPDSDDLRQLNLPGDANIMGHDGEDATGYSPTVYDPMRLDSPELHPIRILPNSYLPKNPNYPSSITDTVWRPTVRMTPIRFYNTRSAGGFERRPDYDEERRYPPTDFVNYPTPDTVNPPDKSRDWKRGKEAFDPAQQTPEMVTEVDKKMEDEAQHFWGEYQHYREQKIPGGPSTIDFNVLDFADIFQGRHELEDEEMAHLFNYMVQIGLMDEYMLHKYLMHQDEKFTQKNTRTHF